MARSRPRPTLFVLIPLLAAGCSANRHAADPAVPADSPSSQGAATVPSPTRAALPVVGADAGLQASVFLSAADAIDLAAALGPYADMAVPMPPDLRELWAAHGLRVLSVPASDVGALTAALHPSGPAQDQWLGQAFAWTEVARGPESKAPRTVALDAERIRLDAGALRLLVRSWLEPAPPRPAVGRVSAGDAGAAQGPEAVLRTEIVPQHHEAVSAAERDDALRLTPPSIDPESQGLLFSRLYARLTLPPGRALVIVPERPGVDWRRAAGRLAERRAAREETRAAAAREAEAAADAAARAGRRTPPAMEHADEWTRVRQRDAAAGPAVPPRQPDPAAGPGAQGPAPVGGAGEAGGRPAPSPPVGRVSRDATPPPPRPARPALDTPAGPAGPAAARIPTLGEAMLMSAPPGAADGDADPAPTLRAVIILTPRVPERFRLIE